MSSRTPLCLSLALASALLAGAALTPAAAVAEPTPQPAVVAPADATADGTASTSALPPLTAEDATAVRERAERLLREHPEVAAGLGTQGTTATADTVNPVVTRHAGSDRYATAANLATTFWRDLFWNEEIGGPIGVDKVVFITSGTSFADALAAGPLAANQGAPILLTRKDALPTATKQALADLRPDYIVVVGGSAAVSQPVWAELAGYVPGPQRVSGLEGKDRYATAANMSRHLFVNGASRAYVTLGTNWPDGLAGGAAAGWEWSPVLLTKKDEVPLSTLEVLYTFLPEEIVVMGGTSAVSEAVVEELELVAPVVRIDGADRYAVAANAAGIHDTWGSATVVSGQNWPDALAASALAGLLGDKLLLVRSTGVPGATEQAVHAHSISWIDALGGPGAVPEAVLDQLRAMEVVVPE